MKRGSALVIAIFIISVVGSISFGMGRLLFLQTDTVVAYENGVSAYYAAESGIEEAFLRYRFNQEIEMPVSSNLFARTDLTAASRRDNLFASSNEYVFSGNQVYDLSIRAQASSLGNTDATGCDAKNQNCILRDEVKVFPVDFSYQDNFDVNLSFTPLANTAASPTVFQAKECVMIEVKIVGRVNDSQPFTERKKMFYNPSLSCNYKNNDGSDMFDRGDTSSQTNYNISSTPIRIDGIKSQVWPSVSLSDAELRIRPIGTDIAFSLSKAGGGKFYGSTAHVESRGYFGGVSKKLTADIDRQSGSLYDLFDYVIYKAN